MVGRALTHLDEITEHLDPAFQPASVILRHASDLLAKHAQASVTPLRAARAAIDAARMIESLPRHTERILGALADGKFRLSVDAVDEDEFLRGLEKIATRLTAGIVVAAMLVGAALAMNVDSDVRLLGGPAVAVVFFILAAIGGLGLLAHVFLVDRRDRRRRRRTE